jgi:MoaA/NifB/PqqE/SkfB family radical SAM enzyme
METSTTHATEPANGVAIQRIWAELTRNCQLACIHCYADSGPAGDHGKMTAGNWMTLVDDARELGVPLVQFIGGEPTMHPQFPAILRHAIGAGIEVEVLHKPRARHG